jgi:hypothetical protein
MISAPISLAISVIGTGFSKRMEKIFSKVSGSTLAYDV